MVLAGYYWMPGAVEQYKRMVDMDVQMATANIGHINSMALFLPFTLLIGITLLGSGLVVLIWRLKRFERK